MEFKKETKKINIKASFILSIVFNAFAVSLIFLLYYFNAFAGFLESHFWSVLFGLSLFTLNAYLMGFLVYLLIYKSGSNQTMDGAPEEGDKSKGRGWKALGFSILFLIKISFLGVLLVWGLLYWDLNPLMIALGSLLSLALFTGTGICAKYAQ